MADLKQKNWVENLQLIWNFKCESLSSYALQKKIVMVEVRACGILLFNHQKHTSTTTVPMVNKLGSLVKYSYENIF